MDKTEITTEVIINPDEIKQENPNMVYGRLAESVHISGYSLERAMMEFRYLLEDDRWMAVGKGYKDINEFVRSLSFKEFKIAVENRKDIAEKLKALEASQRAIAEMLGVSEITVRRDTATNVAQDEFSSNDNQDVTKDTATNVAPDPEPEPEEETPLFSKGANEVIDTVEKTEKKAHEKEEKKNDLDRKKNEYINQSNKDITTPPKVYLSDCNAFLDKYEDDSIDCVLTDPPYLTDVSDINSFANIWVTKAICKVKKSGRLYIFTGAYPKEIQAYLNVFLSQDKFVVDNPLVWTYKNTLGQTPKTKYNLNYQLIWHLYSDQSPQLDTGITNDMFSVQEINAPDGRKGDRIHTWQKPDELANRLIRQGTQKGWLVVDPFVCTGTFLLAAARHERAAAGCDNSRDNLDIAIKRGCNEL